MKGPVHFDIKSLERPEIKFSLRRALALDVLSGAAASLLVSPFIMIIDKAIVRNANNTMPLWPGVKEGFRLWATRP